MAKKKKGPYKQTGNIAVDMVAACINHCERFGKKVEFIRLDKIHWTMFIGYVLEHIPAYDLSDGYVDFDGVTVTEGSFLMTGPIYYELEKQAPKVYLMN